MVVDKYAGRCLDVGSTPTGSIFLFMEDYSRGLRGRVGNAVGVLKRAWVRIPCLPFSFKKDTQEILGIFFLICLFSNLGEFLRKYQITISH